MLPTRVPHFKRGDCPVPGTDLVAEELLGAGGFGEVWKAVHKNRPYAPPVALKFCTDETAARSLRNEVELLDRVAYQGRHKGIVELKYVHWVGETPCLEYEYVEGGDLSGIIRDARARGVPPRQSALIVQELAATIGFAHRLKPPIVHRDLKPPNILVQRSADGKLVFRVADFGIGGLAAGQAIEQTQHGMTQGGLLVSCLRGSYTPLYASPQQMQGDPPDPRDDVYSLGVIWYQLLTGNLGTGAPTGLDWPDDLRQRGMTDEAVGILATCFSGRKDRRPADAAVLVERLAALLAPAPKPPSTPPAPELPPVAAPAAVAPSQGTMVGASPGPSPSEVPPPPRAPADENDEAPPTETGPRTRQGRLTKAEVYEELAASTGLSRKQVSEVFEGLTDQIKRELGKKGPGVFNIPDLVKLTLKRKPATKEGTKPDPFHPGQVIQVKAEPARNTVRARPLKGLNDLVKEAGEDEADAGEAALDVAEAAPSGTVSRREKADKPVFLEWRDAQGPVQQAVSSWKEALVLVTKRALAEGLPADKLPMRSAGRKASLRSPEQVGSYLFIETHGSSEKIRYWVSAMLNSLGKPRRYLRVKTRSGNTLDLPE